MTWLLLPSRGKFSFLMSWIWCDSVTCIKRWMEQKQWCSMPSLGLALLGPLWLPCKPCQDILLEEDRLVTFHPTSSQPITKHVNKATLDQLPTWWTQTDIWVSPTQINSAWSRPFLVLWETPLLKEDTRNTYVQLRFKFVSHFPFVVLKISVCMQTIAFGMD